MKRLLLFAVLITALCLPASAFAAGGGKGNTLGAPCKAGGYLTLVGTGGAFASQDACVSYAVHGGHLYPATPDMTVDVTGPVQGLGALVGNPQSRVAGGITDPAMQFDLSGDYWVPGSTIGVSYTADSPLGYTVADPTSYFPVPASNYPVVAGSGETFAAFFQDNCFDNSNVLVQEPVDYSITASNTLGQSVTKTGSLDCSQIPATILASTGPAVGNGDVYINATGWGFEPTTQLTSMMYQVTGFADGGPFELFTWAPRPTTDASGDFTFQWDGDNCIYGGSLQTTDQQFTMSVSDGTHTASAVGTLSCSLLAN